MILGIATFSRADKCGSYKFPILLGGNDANTVVRCTTEYKAARTGVFVAGYTSSKEVTNTSGLKAFYAGFDVVSG